MIITHKKFTMNIVDSSAWLEYFADTKNAKFFAKTIENVNSLIVPSITIYEVFKKILHERNENEALTIIAHMRLGQVVVLDLELAMEAAKISNEKKIPMADSVIMATAKQFGATVWTMDADFKNQKNVKFFHKI